MLIMIIIEKLSWLMLRLTHVYLYMGNHTISIKSKRFFYEEVDVPYTTEPRVGPTSYVRAATYDDLCLP